MSDISAQAPAEPTGDSTALIQAMADLTTVVETMRAENNETLKRLERVEASVARMELAGLKSLDLPR